MRCEEISDQGDRARAAAAQGKQLELELFQAHGLRDAIFVEMHYIAREQHLYARVFVWCGCV